jgi:hypothetical protein
VHSFATIAKRSHRTLTYRGDCTIHGKKFWMSAWIKEGAKGKYMSFAFREAQESADTKSKAKTSAKAEAERPF